MAEFIAEYPSKSKPGRKYKVKRADDGVIYCDCWQWKINKTCKHTQMAIESLTPKLDDLQKAIEAAVTFMKGG